LQEHASHASILHNLRGRVLEGHLFDTKLEILATCSPTRSAFPPFSPLCAHPMRRAAIHAFAGAPAGLRVSAPAVNLTRPRKFLVNTPTPRATHTHVSRPDQLRACSTSCMGSSGMSAPKKEAADMVAEHLQHPQQSRDIYRGEIFCNRALNMARIAAVGFDMDYTLAMYNSEKFETLSATGALRKLVEKLGYPEELLNLKYDHSFFIRGLVVDKERGNILKLDRHKYVKVALHGFQNMSKQDKSATYDQMTTVGGGFLEPNYALMDTLFSLPDAFLFSALVEHKDKYPGSIHQNYAQIYKDVRLSVDMCHRDGSIKNIVSKYPEEYIQCDPIVFDMLDSIRASGRKTFLLTNSLADYTDTVMSYLYKASGRQDVNPGSSWQDAFDVVITGSCKPGFIVDSSRPLYRCDIKSGRLTNTDGPAPDESPDDYLKNGKSFQGGNFKHLHELLGLDHGSQLLYCGDHIYADIVRSKRSLGWRTMLIVPELEHEILMLNHPETRALEAAIAEKRLDRDELSEWIDRLEMALVQLAKEEAMSPSSVGNIRSDRRGKLENELERARVAVEAMRSGIIADVEQLHAKFHPVWGQMFKSGPQNSLFAEQVANYACIYTGKATNLSLVSPEFYWRAMPDLMPHDRFIDSPMHRLLDTRWSRSEAKLE
jgi:HAD superfamily 5'-nucleotidase-like hydrolase